MLLPSCSDWITALIKLLRSATPVRLTIPRRASSRVLPKRISSRALIISLLNGPVDCSATFFKDMSKPRPASTLTSSKSRVSGSAFWICFCRCTTRELSMFRGKTAPVTADRAISKKARAPSSLANQVIRKARDTKSNSSSTCRVTKLLKVIFQGLPA